MEITGKISAVLELQSGVSQRTGNEWKSQEFVLEVSDGRYTSHACFKLFGGKVDEFASMLTIGNDVKVSFDIDANEYNGRWFNSINAWKIEQPGAAPANATTIPAPQHNVQAPATAPAPKQGDGDELPF